MLPMKWNELVTDLIGCGMTQQEIGAAVGLSQSSVSDIARGLTKDVGWSVGASILSLHQSRTGKAVGDRACSSSFSLPGTTGFYPRRAFHVRKP